MVHNAKFLLQNQNHCDDYYFHLLVFIRDLSFRIENLILQILLSISSPYVCVFKLDSIISHQITLTN